MKKDEMKIAASEEDKKMIINLFEDGVKVKKNSCIIHIKAFSFMYFENSK